MPRGVLLTDPLGYLDFLSLEADAAARPHGLGRRAGGDDLPRRPVLHPPRHHGAARDGAPAGRTRILGLEPGRIREIPERLSSFARPAEPPPLWDGRAAERVCDLLVRAPEAELVGTAG